MSGLHIRAPGSLCPSCPRGGHSGIWTSSLAVEGAREEPAYIRVSLYKNSSFLLDSGHSTLPGPLYQVTAFFQNPGWEKLHKISSSSRIPKSPWEIPILSPSPSTPSLLQFPSILMSHPHPEFLSLSHQAVPPAGPGQVSALLCRVPSGMTGNHHTSWCIIYLSYSVVISINCALVLYFVSLKPTHPLFSQQSLPLADGNLGFHIYFP